MAEQWRILVVESEENLNWNIVNSLQKDGYSVLGVMGGAEAIRTLWNEEQDVVICSQQMPDASGLDLLQWMRTYTPNGRMVMLGTPGDSVGRKQALEMGVAGYLEKPLDLHALKEELRRLLHSTGFSASLDSFDLLDVIQIINMSRKSIALVVNTGLEEQGTLRFQLGELVWAEYGMLRGEEAFFALAAHKNGTVAQYPWNEQTTPNVTQPLSRLIFQALQYRSKYASSTQASSDVPVVKPASPLPTLPQTLQDMAEDDTPFQFTEDDRPFQFVAEGVPVEESPASSPFEQLMRVTSTNAHLEQVSGGGSGMVKKQESEAGKQPVVPEKPWWQPTSSVPAFQASGSMRALSGEKTGSAPKGATSTPPVGEQKATPMLNSTLPSWLTEQPTSMHLPVMRGQTGQMPTVPQERSPVLPKTPPTSLPLSPNSAAPGNAGWSSTPQTPLNPAEQSSHALNLSASGLRALNPSDSGLRRINPEEAQYTMPHRAVKPHAANQRAASAEWQGPLADQTGQMSPVKSAGSGDTLQSLAALKRNSAAMPNDARNGQNSSSSTPAANSRAWDAPAPVQPTPITNAHTWAAPILSPAAQEAVWATPVQAPPASAQPAPLPNEAIWATPVSSTQTPDQSASGAADASDTQGKRNYPALAAALQTLGYSVPGFIAAAVVGLDGTPIAQVAVDERDISALCARLGAIARSASGLFELNDAGEYEYAVISSRSQHILLRLIGNTREVFQALITTRDTEPAQSLDVMANVEPALAAALA